MNIKRLWATIEYQVIDDLDHQTTAGADGNFFTVSEVSDPNLEAIATRAGIVKDLESFVEGHIFDLNLVVYVQVVGHVEQALCIWVVGDYL